tara:strand:- start:2007 stop:3035 length:1029 start_codon:yes stop_codon:yes gene_type:complete
MIKIKILNPDKGRNEPTFRPLRLVQQLLHDYSIELTESDDYDFLFIGMADFINKKVSLQQSIDDGLDLLSNISGDYFLFDGSDSHSLMGSYEVFTQSNAIYLFKQQMHREKHRYAIPKAFNKWFMGSGSGLDLSYDIPNDIWNKIKLTGWNFGHNIPSHKNFEKINKNKSIDICGIFDLGGKEGFDHAVRNDMYYTDHRTQICNVIDKLSDKYNIVTSRVRIPWQEYMQKLYNSKILISPFGMGEIRQGDGEAMQMGTIVCKEDMSEYDFGANIWKENETYIPFKYDCTDLEESLVNVLDNYESHENLIENMRKEYMQQYDPHTLCRHWYNIFNNLESIKEI